MITLCGLRRPNSSQRLGVTIRLIASESPRSALHQSSFRMARDYKAAVEALNSLQANFAVLDAIRKSGRGANSQAIPEMLEWVDRLGYKPTDMDKLNPIHIAGTKGKGSTSAFVSSILCQYPVFDPGAPRKIGLYTSPHLRSVRERIQINNTPLSEDKFAEFFFQTWDRLGASAEKRGPMQPSGESRPSYFRFLTLMAYHTFLSEGVDTAIFECGVGGEHDSTNIIVAPTVCAVTNLDIDHVAALGGTIEEIAWHKGGIFKTAARSKEALTVYSQPPTALKVLKERAEEKGMTLRIVQRDVQVESGQIRLGLAADFQKTNSSLAMQIVIAHLRVLGSTNHIPANDQDIIPLPMIRGLQNVKWGGRCETRHEKGMSWHIDGGHTQQSIRLAGEWFASCIGAKAKKKQKRVLVFNQQTRDAPALARTLYKALADALGAEDEKGKPLFDHAVFSTNVTFAAAASGDAHYKPDLVSINTSAADVFALKVQNELATVWAELDSGCKSEVKPTIQETIERVRKWSQEGEEETFVLVTGSLHLVGGVLEVLETIGVTADS